MDSKSRTNEQDGDDRRQIECPEESMSLAAADGEIAADIDEKVDDGGPENDDKGEETHTPSFIFREVKGDLFSQASPNASLVHCVSADMRLGKGIAALFKRRYGGIDELIRQNKKVGQVAFLSRRSRTNQPIFILNLVTKEKYWHKPTLKSLQSSLRELKAFCVKKGVEELAMPRIGCGLDGLALEDVKGLLLKTFEGSKMQITMFYL